MRRDEVRRLEAAVRDANPVPCVDDLVGSNAAAAVALLVKQRRRTMTTTPAPPTIQRAAPSWPRRRWSTAWAFTAGFVVVLLGVGAAALFLRDGGAPLADAPAPSPTATISHVATSAAAVDRDLIAVVAGWQRITDPWLADASIDPLPGGGFIAASDTVHVDGSAVMWSPDGLNWLDGDPRRLVPRARRDWTVVGDQVIVLAGGDDAPALWIGDPRTGEWEPMLELDTSGLEPELVPGSIRMAAGRDALLVSGVTPIEAASSGGGIAKIGSFVVWLVDPELEGATRTRFLVEPPIDQRGWGVEWEGDWYTWFDGRWHVMLSRVLVDWSWGETSLWSSPDGTTWIEEDLPAGWRTPVLNAMTVGSSGAVTCAAIDGDERATGTWFSSNGVDWRLLGRENFCRGAYSDQLGFVFDGGPGFYRLSPDGTQLDVWTSPFPFDVVEASGNNLIVDAFRGSEYTAAESAGYRGLWLYHRPDD